jgi:hypothetical protein
MMERVTKDYAMLAAQVIPVMALALGLEIRSLAGRYVEARRANGKSPEEEVVFGIFFLIIFLSVVQIFLSAMEVTALENVVATPPEGSAYNGLLGTSVFIVFLAPLFESVVRILHLRNPKSLQRGIRRTITVWSIFAGFIAIGMFANFFVS